MRSGAALTLILVSPHLARAIFDWNNFPLCAQPVLQANAPQSCDYGSDNPSEAAETDACLCQNLGFLTDAAQGIFGACGCDVLDQSAQTLTNNCAKYGTSSDLGVEDLIKTGSSTCSGAGGGGNGLDAGVVAGIIVAVLIGVITFALMVFQALISLDFITNRSVRAWAPFKIFRACFKRLCCC